MIVTRQADLDSGLPARSTAVNKRGVLALLRDPTSNQWRKYWFVQRRPYLYIYSSNAEAEEAAVINVSTVRVEQSPEIEQMLEVRPRDAERFSCQD